MTWPSQSPRRRRLMTRCGSCYDGINVRCHSTRCGPASSATSPPPPCRRRPWRRFQLDRIRFTDAIGGSTDKGNPEGGEGKIVKPTVPFQLGGISASSNASIFVNGKTVYTLSTPLPTRDETMAWFIGQQGAANVEFFIGDIAEILVYNRSLSTSELKSVKSYLHRKWQ